MPTPSSKMTGDAEQPPKGVGDTDAKSPDFLEKWTSLLVRGISAITIEPMMFLHAASMMMMYVIAQSLKIYKICRGTFGHEIEVCRNLTAYKDLEKEVQAVASDYGMYWALIQTVPSLFLTMVLGPWSDKHGRKFPMAFPLVGSILGSIVFILSAQFEELPPLFLLVGPALAGLSGGMMVMIMAVFSYVADISDSSTRTIRLGFVYGVWFLGSPAGSVTGGILMSHYGYTTVFLTGTIVLTFCLIYLLVRVEESVVPPTDGSNRGWFRDLFDVKNLTDSFRTCMKKRPNNKRCQLWVLMLALCGMFLPLTGEGNVRYLYTRLKFGWDESMFSYYTAAILAVGSIGVIVIMPFLTKILGVSDPLMVVLAILMKVVSEIITAFAHTGWMLFVSAIPTIYECSGPPIRSMMSKCVESDEVGKVFSMLAVIESGIPIVSGVMYSQVYNATLHHFPGTVFLVSAVIFLLVMLSMIWLVYDVKHQDAISKNNEDSEKNEKELEKNCTEKVEKTDDDFKVKDQPTGDIEKDTIQVLCNGISSEPVGTPKSETTQF